MPENKVIFGLRNAHYSVVTEGVDGTLTYATPVILAGAVEISLDPKGDQADFYADDVLYYTSSSNQGYETTLTVANIPRSFRIDVLGEVLEGTDNVLTENANAKPKKIAFMFEFDGDIKATRHVLYNCTVSRTGLNSATKTETAEPQTQELTLVAAPRPADGIVKRSTTGDTPDAVYNAWYTAVYNPVAP
ncbi:phage tail protein [Bacillus sp. ISL-75]|uniref:major tail protein n=1 Tax=Bacillus sp. ISL-75 TaxID=2819137 RepID=UPI001BE52F36|nr:major tail protein [Bacillus sp. ISL-75]MBT2728397.1 phage tail protein [Bacillus sp. ISL-75]